MVVVTAAWSCDQSNSSNKNSKFIL